MTLLAEMDWLQPALVAVGLGAAAFFAGVFKLAQRLTEAAAGRIEKRISGEATVADKRQNYLGIKDIAKLYEIFENIVGENFVDRILLFTGANGGGVPKAGKPYFVSATAGWSTNGGHPERPYSGRIPPDAFYMASLVEMIEQGSVTFTTETMPPKSHLKAWYKQEGVVQSMMFWLQLDAKELIYCSIASYKAEFTDGQRIKLEMYADQVRGLMGSSISEKILAAG